MQKVPTWVAVEHISRSSKLNARARSSLYAAETHSTDKVRAEMDSCVRPPGSDPTTHYSSPTASSLLVDPRIEFSFKL